MTQPTTKVVARTKRRAASTPTKQEKSRDIPTGGRVVEWVDEFGQKSRRMIPLNAPEEHAKMGVLIGPPDLEPLNLPLDVQVRLNNQLYARNLFTIRDVRTRPGEVVAAVMAAWKVDAQKVAELYVVD